MLKKYSKKVWSCRQWSVVPVVVALALPLAGWWAPSAVAAETERGPGLDPDAVAVRLRDVPEAVFAQESSELADARHQEAAV